MSDDSSEITSRRPDPSEGFSSTGEVGQMGPTPPMGSRNWDPLVVTSSLSQTTPPPPQYRQVVAGMPVGAIPEWCCPPPPSEMPHPPYAPWAGQEQLRQFVERCVQEALDDLLASDLCQNGVLRLSRRVGDRDEER
jgi:hypothetical protein